MRRFAGALAALAIAGGALWYLTAPPKGVDGYRDRAASTLVSLRSQTQSARIWVETVSDDEATRPATLVGLEEAEADADSAASSFAGYEPPTSAAAVRERVTQLAERTTSQLAALRIAAQQERWQELPTLARPLRVLAPRLAKAEEELGG